MGTCRSVLKIIVTVKFRGFYSFCINSGLKSVKGALSGRKSQTGKKQL